MSVNTNKCAAIIFLLLGIVILIAIPSQIPESTAAYGPKLFPQIVSGVVILSSIGILIQEFVIKRKTKGQEKQQDKSKFWKIDKDELIKVGSMFLIICIYVFLIEVLGFILSSILFVVSMLIFYKSKKWNYYVISIASVVIIYYLFKIFLKVYLP